MPHPGSDIRRRRAEVREANEQLSLSLLGTEAVDLTLECECGGPDCRDELTLTRNAYRRISRGGRLFVVREGHELLDGRVVQRNGTFVVVDAG